jgi:hypothetical protein
VDRRFSAFLLGNLILKLGESPPYFFPARVLGLLELGLGCSSVPVLAPKPVQVPVASGTEPVEFVLERILLVIILVTLLRGVKDRLFEDLGYHRFVISTGPAQFHFGFFCGFFLFGRGIDIADR